MDDEVVIDASGAILGRLASIVAKRLLSGERIVIVNAEKAVLSGKRLSLLREMKEFLQVGHPGKGPHHPRRPDRILRRTIRGMLPRRKPKGVEAYRRLKVYLGVPKEYEGVEFEVVSEAKVDKLRCPYVTLGELAKGIGWNPEV
ncbi:50S ribosomal protein L13 [Candidatus Bathyarchaeota archaeon]|nr:50S ribosomal protein L13 [Candidatus Bathyarchaeota archaeon]